MPPFESRAARALVSLLEIHLRRCVATWHRARAANVPLPPAPEPHYESLDALLGHILEAAREELLWICRQLDLPDPAIDPLPASEDVDAYVEHLLACWRQALAPVTDDALYEPEYVSDWGLTYSILSMLEHVVMHALRHEFQLAELLANET